MLPFCCHRGLSNGEMPLFTGFFTGAKLFPLNCGRGFGGYIVDYAVYALYLVYYSAGCGVKHVIGDSRPVRGHKIACHNRSERNGVIVGSEVAHNADRAHIGKEIGRASCRERV